MKVEATELEEVIHLEPKVFGDDRGWFVETWARARYAEHGIGADFVQDNASWSQGGTLRGLHLQHPHDQGKLVSVLYGEVFDVAVDVRVGSKTFGRSASRILSASKKNQLWIPPGFAHGFCVTSEQALFVYKCTDAYHPETELGIVWNDPDLAIVWPVTNPILSARDAASTRLADLDRSRLPLYRP